MNYKFFSNDIYEIIHYCSNVNLEWAGHGVYIGNCPFCDDTEQGLRIYCNSNTYKCIPCGISGGINSFMEKYESKFNG